jgi:hypothetical protein
LKQTLFWLFLLSQLCACNLISNPNPTQVFDQIVSQTQTALAKLPQPQAFTPSIQSTDQPATPDSTALTTIPVTQVEEIPTQPSSNLSEWADCGGILLARIVETPEYTKDLFEHHAQGVFINLFVEMSNVSDQIIQVWDEDYILQGSRDEKLLTYSPQKAATGYLFIVRGGNLYQDQLKPGQSWKTYLSFDVDPLGQEWMLVVKPGNEIGQKVCEVSLSLSKQY